LLPSIPPGQGGHVLKNKYAENGSKSQKIVKLAACPPQKTGAGPSFIVIPAILQVRSVGYRDNDFI
jgi:hypothetical protein